MNIIKFLSLLLITTGPVSCSFLPSSGSISDTLTSGFTITSATTSEDTTSSVDNGPDIVSTPEYVDFFATTSKVSINITISKDNLVRLEEYGLSGDEREDEYFPISITIDVDNGTLIRNYAFEQVGLRMKGNLSKDTFIDHETGYIYNLIHFKVSFDHYVLNQRFLSMSSFDLKWNRNVDDTNIRQVYAYKMFKDYLDVSLDATLGNIGITQTSDHGNTFTDLGVYTILETVDKRLIKRQFPFAEAEGNLYKVRYTSEGPAEFRKSGAVLRSGSTYVALTNGKIGIEDLATNYHPSYDLKTNNIAPNFSDIANLIGNIDNSTDYDSDANKAILDNLMEMESFLKMEAVAYFMGNPDDFRNNYNNLYLYFVPSTGRAIFIPYDFDRAFGMNGNWDPTGNSMTQAAPYATKAYGFGGDQEHMNPLYRFTIFSGAHPTYRAMYTSYLNQILDSEWLTDDYFENMYHDYELNYSGEVSTDNDLPYCSFSLTNNSEFNWTFSSYLDAKRNTTYNSL